MRRTFAKAVTWRLIGTAEVFAISLWMTGQMATAGHTAVIAAIASFLSYIVHELAWNGCFSRERVGYFVDRVMRTLSGSAARRWLLALGFVESKLPSRLLDSPTGVLIPPAGSERIAPKALAPFP